MIVDCYTHTWDSPDQLGRCIRPRAGGPPAPHGLAASPSADAAHHSGAAQPVDVTLVLGFKAHYLEADIPNERVSSYVARNPDRLLGFAGVDPSRPKEAIAELERAYEELSMPGIAVAPAAQDFHPSNSQAMLVYAQAAQRGMPIIFHTGVYMTAATKLEYAQPVLLDEIARELPDLKMVVAHMGYPWVSETVQLLAKHKQVFAEISWLLDKPWEAYRTLLTAHQHGVIDKLLFGSGFPHAAAPACIEALYSINHLVHGTNLPIIPREQLRGIVERDALSLLGLPTPQRPPTSQLQPTPAGAEDTEE